jgi:tRNA nucleotidyltransferase/poly(A) polymerase
VRHTSARVAHFPKFPIAEQYPAINHVFDLAADRDTPIYLVGGTVRDLLLGQDTHDLDFVAQGNGLELARDIADRLGGAFVALDQERKTGRVLLGSQRHGATPPDESHPLTRALYLDIASLRGNDLESDLRGRDFTINAIAAAPAADGAWQIYDPLDGSRDLAQRTLRMVSPSSFVDDPIRTLRAVRMQAQFGCIIETQTRSRLQAATPLLSQMSAERVRDEWFTILQLPGAANALRALDQLGLLRIIAPPLTHLKDASPPAPEGQDTLHHAIECVHAIEQLWAAFGQCPSELPSLLPATLIVLAPQIRQRYESRICDERTHLALLKCAALLCRTRGTVSQDAAAKTATKLGSQWRCSKREIALLRTAVRYHTSVLKLAEKPSLSRRAIYRYYFETGEYGIDATLISLAGTLASWEGERLPEGWNHQAQMVAQLLRAWFEHRDTLVSPPLYLSGNDLICLLGLSPGPQIGDLLHRLREEQAAGEICTRQEAIARVRQWASRARDCQNHTRV